MRSGLIIALVALAACADHPRPAPPPLPAPAPASAPARSGRIAEVRRVHLVIRGRVQGVSYRASAVDAAGRIGVTGWVRNEPDGSVTAEVQGPPDRVDLMIDWCKHGPSQARVDGVEVNDLPAAVSSDDGFTIRR